MKGVKHSTVPKGMSEKELEAELDGIEVDMSNADISKPTFNIQASKPIAQVKKRDHVIIDGKSYAVDSHYVLIDHGTTKEMAIEIYDQDDKDYQIRYFNDQAESTMEFYELQEIMFVKKVVKVVEW